MNNSIGSSGSSSSSYPSMMPGEHDSALSGGSFRIFDSSYNSYSPHPPPYSDYATASKLEAFDYNYWPSTATTTHNILALPTTANTTGTVLDQIRTPPPSLSSSGQPIETLLPVSSVHLAQINATTTISATHHHHHIYQHVYPAPSNDPSTWLGSGEYQPLHTAANPANFRHYPTSCSLYPSNNFYDPSQTPQWTTAPHSSHLPIKFEPPYSPPYMESIHHLDQPSSEDALQHHEHISKDEPADSSLNKSRQQQQQQQQFDWLKQPPPSASSSSGIPPKNPVNGKTRTRDKYRIVYTDHQRYELENEFVVSKYITIPRKAALSMNLSLSERQIKIWFQNRRAKERKLNKKRQELCHHQLNNSNDADSPSDGGPESPNYYQNYA